MSVTNASPHMSCCQHVVVRKKSGSASRGAFRFKIKPDVPSGRCRCRMCWHRSRQETSWAPGISGVGTEGESRLQQLQYPAKFSIDMFRVSPRPPSPAPPVLASTSTSIANSPTPTAEHDCTTSVERTSFSSSSGNTTVFTSRSPLTPGP